LRSRRDGSTSFWDLRRYKRSFRKVPFSTIASRFRLVAETSLKSLFCSLGPPMGRKRFSSKTRKNFFCTLIDNSPISSRKSVPWWAIKIRPSRSCLASVKAPRTWPKRLLSIKDSFSAEQSTTIKCLSSRGLFKWMALANNSLPVPVSPVIRILWSPPADSAACSRASLMTTLAPTILLRFRIRPLRLASLA